MKQFGSDGIGAIWQVNAEFNIKPGKQVIQLPLLISATLQSGLSCLQI
jgi:hypothetical protein